MNESFGYFGDGFEPGQEARAHVPSHSGEGDPLAHSPLTPTPERHGDWQVYNPEKVPVDMTALDEALVEYDTQTSPLSDEEVLRRLEQEFEQ